ncbi:IS200/IS605 family transposase [Flavobacterium sp.]|uniref:IS200/IS605 family transposase n=1 Tax=Flavobacterium sp. TaxID=239 RepID=UPI0025D365E7|nr:IS200/IS605 family transposase [Flavobacterium sp.]
MANTYTQIHLQFVFAVKYRDGLIHSSFKDELYQYITGIIKNHNHKLLAINGMPDHVHILVGMRPTQSVSDLMQDIKGSSSKWINEKRFLKVKFEWQEGYGAFSYAKSQVNTVVNYIKNQEQHHAVRSFNQEYLEFLAEFEVVYDERYIFKAPI